MAAGATGGGLKAARPRCRELLALRVGVASNCTPRFPASMRFADVEGTARFQFVVDTLGRVELPSVRELERTRGAFGLAVRSALPRMRFTPALVGGRPVRQLVEFPIVFRIQR